MCPSSILFALLVGGQGAPPLSPDTIEAHLRHLASPAFEGRATGSPGGVAAGRWIAETLAAAGVAPAGDVPDADGIEGYLQHLDLWRSIVDELPALTLHAADGGPLAAVHGADFTFSGSGISRGELELVVVRAASEIPAEYRNDAALALDASAGRARRWLRDSGHENGIGWGLLIVRGRGDGGEPDPTPPRFRRDAPRPLDVLPPPPATLSLVGELRERLFAGEFTRVDVSAVARTERMPAFNVVGVVRGVGSEDAPALAEDAVVVSAHYDHLGIDTRKSDEPGVDRIYDGADDDASGVVTALALAGRLAAGAPPARSVVFLLVTGEERGLLGSRHYVEHPVLPLERTVFDLNLEMLGRPDPLVGGAGHFWLTGYERTNVGRTLAEGGAPIVADPRPDQRFFLRSDNAAFAYRGIPAQTLSSFGMHDEYHSVDDEPDTLDFKHLAAAARVAWSVLDAVASGALTPAWEGEGAPEERRRR